MRLVLDSKTIKIDTRPILMIPADVIVHIQSILEMLVTGRAMVAFIRSRTKVEFAHVSPHVIRFGQTLSTNQANAAAITSSSVVLHHFIQSEGLFSIHS